MWRRARAGRKVLVPCEDLGVTALGTVITIPRKLYEEVKRRGLDPEQVIVELLAKELELDPIDEAHVHLELAEKILEEDLSLLEKGDVVQASGKLYKAAEEAVKAMALALGLSEAHEARRRGRWTLGLLDDAVRRLAERLGRRVRDEWDHARFLHVEGFHEARLTVEQVKARAHYVREMVEAAKTLVEKTVDTSSSSMAS